jgi:Outer membrane protein beta-barrel family/Carboxypeptidase regulatory-like domain
MKMFLTYLLFLGASYSICAQKTTCVLIGRIVDEGSKGISGATISIFSITDSLPRAATVSDENGHFEFIGLKSDTLLVVVSHATYQSFRSTPIFVHHAGTTNLPLVILRGEAKTLQEFTVSAKKKLLEQDVDKTIINVDAMVGNASNNSLEVLSKSPGVTVDEKGTIALNGKTGVLVLVDGRSTYMSGEDLATYLRSIPGGMLDKIELIDNPSAKYEAEGSAVINLRLKKRQRSGFVGNVGTNLSQGRYLKNSEFVTLDYGRGKAHWFSSFAYNFGTGYSNRINQRIQEAGNGQPVSLIDLQNRSVLHNHSYLGKIGGDLATSTNTTLGFQIFGQSTPRRERSTYSGTIFHLGNGIDSSSSGNSINSIKSQQLAANVNFQTKFKTSGELRAEANYVIQGNRSIQPFNNFLGVLNNIERPLDSVLYRLGFDTKVYNLKSDYTIAVQKVLFLEAGIKSSFVRNDNDSRTYSVKGNSYRENYNTSNHFIYDESISAGYIDLKKTSGRLRWQLGMRIENTRINGEQLGNDSVPGNTFKRRFTDFFPSLSIQYRLDSAGRTTLQLAITRKIARPGYYQYNPFQTFVDRYNYNEGNPSLLATYPTGYVLTLQHRQYLSLRLGYGLKQGLVFQAIEVRDNVFIHKPENLGKEQMLFATAGFNLSPRPWLSVNYNFQIRHFRYAGTICNHSFDLSVVRFGATFLNQFSIGQSWTADVSFEMIGKDFDDLAYRLSRHGLSASIQRKLWRGKGSLSVGVDDLLHSLKTNYIFAEIPSVSAKQRLIYDSQRIRLGISYNFGSSNASRKNNHSEDAAAPEIERLKN